MRRPRRTFSTEFRAKVAIEKGLRLKKLNSSGTTTYVYHGIGKPWASTHLLSSIDCSWPNSKAKVLKLFSYFLCSCIF